MSSISRRVRVTGWMWPTRTGGVPGQGDVDRVGGEARVELAGLERGLRASSAASSALRAPVRARANRALLLRGQVADAAQDRGQLGLAAQVADAELLERGGIGRRGDRGGPLGA